MKATTAVLGLFSSTTESDVPDSTETTHLLDSCLSVLLASIFSVFISFCHVKVFLNFLCEKKAIYFCLSKKKKVTEHAVHCQVL